MRGREAMLTMVTRVLPVHKWAVERMAQADGEPVAVVVRRLIRAEAQRRGLWPVTMDSGNEEANA
jgi:hypothetical protein